MLVAGDIVGDVVWACAVGAVGAPVAYAAIPAAIPIYYRAVNVVSEITR